MASNTIAVKGTYDIVETHIYVYFPTQPNTTILEMLKMNKGYFEAYRDHAALSHHRDRPLFPGQSFLRIRERRKFPRTGQGTSAAGILPFPDLRAVWHGCLHSSAHDDFQCQGPLQELRRDDRVEQSN